MEKKTKKRYRVLVDPKNSEEYYINALSQQDAKNKAWERYLKKAVKKNAVRIIVDSVL